MQSEQIGSHHRYDEALYDTCTHSTQQWSTLNDELKELEAIYHINIEFRDRLAKRLPDGHIAEVFTDAISKFRGYSDYINGYDDALSVLSAAKKANPALDAFLKVYFSFVVVFFFFLNAFFFFLVPGVPW